MSAFSTVVHLVYLVAAVLFVRGLHDMNSPITARRGNLMSAAAMGVAVAATAAQLLHDGQVRAYALIALVAGLVVGTGIGVVAARRIKMTAMPQLVSLFNTVGGGAAALVAVVEATGGSHGALGDLTAGVSVPVALDVVIGAITFSGSLIAAGKLQGLLPGRPLSFPGSRPLTAVLAAVAVISGALLVTGVLPGPALAVAGVTALAAGVLLVLPIGGADMPVVISLLNALTGTAVAMAGFVVDNTVMVTAGALVGASGSILTILMATAMNRSLLSIVVGGFGTDDSTGVAVVGESGGAVRSVTADDVAVQLAYAHSVVVIPGFGLAAAQAQHALVDLAATLTQLGVDVRYAIHPVAGRMPGHMNVLLAEAHVPYDQMIDLEEANRLLPHADVALVIGANDVVNPLARVPGSAIAGMPILDADKAAAVVVMKRSMGHGYAGVDNPLFVEPRTGMLFADAKVGLEDLQAAVVRLGLPIATPA